MLFLPKVNTSYIQTLHAIKAHNPTKVNIFGFQKRSETNNSPLSKPTYKYFLGVVADQNELLLDKVNYLICPMI